MKKTAMGIIAGMIALAGGWAAYGQTSAARTQDVDSQHTTSQQVKTFFQFIPRPSVRLVLKPDPDVMKSFPNYTPPKTMVCVYLPVYPGATPTRAVAGIGDLGSPMTPNLVDGTVYFQSKSSVPTIESWYSQRLKKLGYQQSGSGETSRFGVGVSSFVAFSHNGDVIGSPTQMPDIHLGFLKQGKETLFKLRVTYIIVPPRPANSYLPTDVVKVEVTMGNQTKIVTDHVWISNVVSLINGLQVSVAGTSSCPAVVGGTEPIYAQFYRANGSSIPVVFGLPCGVRGVTVANSTVMLRGSVQLDRDIEGLFNSASSS